MHYFEESYRYFPSNFDNLIILGFLYFREEIYEKAISFFEIASKVQPDNVNFSFKHFILFTLKSLPLMCNMLNVFINLETTEKQ